jgi:prevent-host-death family protein
MEITTKELRMQPGRIIDQAANGMEVIITYRGKPIVKIVPIKDKNKHEKKGDITIFGLWKDHDDINNIEEHVRELRKGRQF